MITTSAEYKSAINQAIRHFHGSIDITWSDTSIDPTISASVNDMNRNGDAWIPWTPQALCFPEQASNSKKNPSYKWAIIGEGLVADGTFHPMPNELEKNSYECGWIGGTPSNGSAQWSTNPELTLTFESRSMTSLSVVGDSIKNEYPVDFTVKLYNGGSLLHTETVTSNSQVTWTKTITAVNNVNKAIITVSRWSAANRVIKFLEFFSIVKTSYLGDELCLLELLEEREIEDGSIPIGNISCNECYIEMQNIVAAGTYGPGTIDPFYHANDNSQYHDFIKPNRVIEPKIGIRLPGIDDVYEWITLGKYWSGDWDTSMKKGRVSTRAWDRMRLLSKAVFAESQLYKDITLYDLAVLVLTHARDSIQGNADMTWSIDTELQLDDYVIPLAYFPVQSYFKCLKQIVEACRGQCYMSRNDVLTITGPSFAGNASTLVVNKDNAFDIRFPAKFETLKNIVKVHVYELYSYAPIQQIYTEDLTFTAGETKTIICDYSKYPAGECTAQILEASVEGITIQESSFYATTATIKISSTSAATCELRINGRHYYDNSDHIAEASDADSIILHGRQEYEYPLNNLIQYRKNAEAIADGLLELFMTYRKDCNVEWRGDPSVELGDIGEITEYQRGDLNNVADFMICRNKLTFDGTLRGEFDGRRVGTLTTTEGE